MRDTPTNHAERAKVQSDIEAFLKAGGNINVIPNGIGKGTLKSWKELSDEKAKAAGLTR